MLRCCLILGVLLSGLSTLGRSAGGDEKTTDLPPAATKKVDFAADIQPIFARACFKCHGAEKQKSGYRLDQKAAAIKGGDSGPAVIPGNSAESALIKYVAGLDPDMVMPPEGQRLTRDEISLLRAWIDQGAAWPESADAGKPQTWWSLEPLERPAVPKLDGAEAAWARTPVDAFIAAKQREKGLTPTAEADRRTLIRRLYFDMIGLPPKPEEIDAFVNDIDPRAYELLVDRLLDSPRYGERWARHWLDVAHYGDTHGYDKDQPRPYGWPYRDYVIRAFNEDRPYGRFIQEQIAGDVLYPGTRDGIEALGFIAAGPWDLIGHAEVPETKTDGKIARLLDRDDMVSNTMNAFCSLTVQCARCHNHKFDPVTQEDYYSLQAVFAAVDRAHKTYDLDPEIALRRASLQQRRTELTAKKEQARAGISADAKKALAALDEQIVELEQLKKGSSSKVAQFGYHSQIVPKPDTVKWVQVDLGKSIPLSKISLHACQDGFNNIGAGFGFPPRYKVELSDDATFAAGVATIADYTQADVPNPLLTPVEIPVNTQPARYVRVTATKLAPRQNDYIFALSEMQVYDVDGRNVAAGPTATGVTVKALDTIEAPPRWRTANLVDGYYPGAQLSSDPVKLASLKVDREKLIEASLDEATRALLAEATAQLAKVDREIALLPALQTVFAGTIHNGSGNFRGTGPDGGKPREIHLLRRGDVRDPRQVVGPGTVPIVPGLTAKFELSADAPEGQRRAALARWLADERNPLTWRSIVNRVWQYHFGRGIVETSNDFGRMGQLPSHPELLDWLAVEMRDGGGSIKHLHRLIVNSATYRQGSATNEKFAAVDSGNVYLWRMNRRRLDAESIRDAVLSAAGKLKTNMGGPGFRDFVIEHPAHSPHYEYRLHDPEDALTHRRSIYRFIVRSQPQPFMTTLDCADPSMSVEKRNESLTALQALALLNNRLMVVMAGHFAERLETQTSDLPARIDAAYRLALGRAPTAEERERTTKYAGEFGLANACRVIFNLSEFVFVD